MEKTVMITMSEEEFRKIIQEEVDKAIENRLKIEGRIKQLPPLLTRTEFMEVMHIGPTTTSAIFARPDFKVFRQGRVLVETEFLFKWINDNSDWQEVYKSRSRKK